MSAAKGSEAAAVVQPLKPVVRMEMLPSSVYIQCVLNSLEPSFSLGKHCHSLNPVNMLGAIFSCHSIISRRSSQSEGTTVADLNLLAIVCMSYSADLLLT